MRIAILDMYNGTDNVGLESIKHSLELLKLKYSVYKVRDLEELPDLDYDLYLSTGGPGDPREAQQASWFKTYSSLVQQIKLSSKKLVAICYSFQLLSIIFNAGTVTKREKMAFGIYRVSFIKNCNDEIVKNFIGSKDEVIEFRNYQVLENDFTNPDLIICKDRVKTGFDYEPAILMYKFTNDIIGTQFHPEIRLDSLTMKYKVSDNSQQEKNASQIRDGKVVKMLNDLDCQKSQIINNEDFTKLICSILRK